ncbi:CIR protein, partial [Plasmodium chabaudi adami]
CEFLIEADSYFNDKNVDTEEINKHLTIKGYCYNDDCKTNEDSINALTTYIFKEFKKSIKNDKYNEYDECFLMWLSDKLLKIHIESKGKKDEINYMDGTTLNQAYKNYLEKHKVKLGYWVFFDNIKGLKEANLKYMAEFYKLLNNICKTIADYNDNGAESRKLSKYSKNCLSQYRTLYMNISECKSYLRLLNKLKGIYDDFRNYAIQENSSKNNLETKLKKLTREDGVEMNAVRGFKPYRFSKKKCYSRKKKPNPGPAPTTTIQKESPGSHGVSNAAGGQLSNQENTSKGSDSGQDKTTNEIGKQGGGIVHKPEQSPDGQHQNSGSKQGNSIDGPENSDVLENRGKIPSTDEPEKQPLVSEVKEPSLPETSQETQLQTQSDPAQKEGSNHSDGQGASKCETKDSGSERGNGDGGANEPGAPSGG